MTQPDAKVVREHDLGDYVAVLMTEFKRPAHCLHGMAVYKKECDQPLIVVTAEKNRMARLSGGGSHFLCMLYEGRHSNFGASSEWATIEKFEEASLQRIRQVLTST